MEDEENLAEQVVNSINDWFDNYDWDSAFIRMTEKYDL